METPNCVLTLCEDCEILAAGLAGVNVVGATVHIDL